MFKLPRIEMLSFWLGFIAATLFWFLVWRLKPLLPKIIAWYKNYSRELRLRNLMGVNDSLRKDALRRAQRAHLAAPLFSLDELIIIPRLLAPPPKIEPDSPGPSLSLAEQIIPYLPDWPEFASAFNVPTLSLPEALANRNHIAIVGRPGSGKTVALAYLTSIIARQDAAAGPLAERTPLYTHILDLDTTLPDENSDPLANIHKAFSSRVSVLVQPQLSRFLSDQFTEGNVLLLIDGLDELPQAEFPPVSAFLSKLLDKYPKTQVVTAANYEYFDGLGKLGFVPLALTAWNDIQRTEFLERWTQNWNTHIAPEITRQTSMQPISPLLINNWLRGERGAWSPLEWTLKVWGAYTGDLKAASAVGSIETFVSRFVTGPVTRPSLEALAREFVVQGRSALPYDHLEKLLTSMAPVQAAPEETEAEAPLERARKGSAKKGGDLISSAGELMLISLANNGLLVEHTNSQLSFSTPALAGYLSCYAMFSEDIHTALENPYWDYSAQALRYTALRGQEVGWINVFLGSEELPLYRRLLTAARWLPDSPPNAPWRSSILRGLASLIQTEMLPFSLRVRFLAAFTGMNDPSVLKLFQQLFLSQSPVVRQMAALGAGAFGDPASVNNLIELLADPESNVRNAACFSLAAIRTDQALSVVAEALLQGDEALRQSAAEALIFIPGLGPETIKEATRVEDLLTRRASVFGLLRVREPWTKELLEKMTVEDGQWVVRNAAANALEEIQNPNPYIPKPLPPAWESAWLIEFAAKHGQGVLPGDTPTDLLLLALTSGTADDQIMALEYLKDLPVEKTFIELFKLVYGNQPDMQEVALQTLRYLVSCGVELPSPRQYGYG